MIHHCSSGGMVLVCRPVLMKPMCLASGTDQLRTQLDQLHAEAETTRAKASSARLRLMRLSEAAEKLKRQAAISVNSGKENDARDLLFQKKKVMQAMERSKSRIELLDQLSSKLIEAISIKESQLIGNVASDLEVDKEDDSSPVRVVSPKQEVAVDAIDDEEFGFDENQPMDKDSIISGLKDISSYEGFLEHLDVQLNKIEAELVGVLNVSALVLNDNDKPNNSKVQQTIELLESVRVIRQKVARLRPRKVEIS